MIHFLTIFILILILDYVSFLFLLFNFKVQNYFNVCFLEFQDSLDYCLGQLLIPFQFILMNFITTIGLAQ